MCRNVDKNLQVPEMYLPNLDAQLLTVWEEFTDEQTDREISCIIRFYNTIDFTIVTILSHSSICSIKHVRHFLFVFCIYTSGVITLSLIGHLLFLKLHVTLSGSGWCWNKGPSGYSILVRGARATLL